MVSHCHSASGNHDDLPLRTLLCNSDTSSAITYGVSALHKPSADLKQLLHNRRACQAQVYRINISEPVVHCAWALVASTASPKLEERHCISAAFSAILALA